MHKRKIAVAVGLVVGMVSSSAAAQIRIWERHDPNHPDEESPSQTVDLFAFVQPRFSYEQHDTRNPNLTWEPAPGFQVRRARLGAITGLTTWASMIFELELAGEQVRSLDAFARFSPIPEAQFSVGQLRVPFSRQNLLPSRAWQLPDPAFFVAPKFLVDRDQGGMLHGDILDGRVRYFAGVFNGFGAGQQENVDPYFMIAGRLEVAPLGKLPNFESDVRPLPDRKEPRIGVGGGGMINCLESDDLKRTYLGADLAGYWHGVSLYAEVYSRKDRGLDVVDSPSGRSGSSLLGICERAPKATDTPDTIEQVQAKAEGYNIQLAGFLPLDWFEEHIELVARHQYIDPNTKVENPDGYDIDATNPTQGFRSFEFGLNWFIDGLRADYLHPGGAHNAKVQISYEIRNEVKECMTGQEQPNCTGFIKNNVLLVQATGGF